MIPPVRVKKKKLTLTAKYYKIKDRKEREKGRKLNRSKWIGPPPTTRATCEAFLNFLRLLFELGRHSFIVSFNSFFDDEEEDPRDERRIISEGPHLSVSLFIFMKTPLTPSYFLPWLVWAMSTGIPSPICSPDVSLSMKRNRNSKMESNPSNKSNLIVFVFNFHSTRSFLFMQWVFPALTPTRFRPYPIPVLTRFGTLFDKKPSWRSHFVVISLLFSCFCGLLLCA